LSKQYIDEKGEHIPKVNKKGMIGTARYASINAHKGIEQSRRDDLESLGYILLYFYLGVLPWQKIKCDNKEEKYKKIMNMKINTPLEKLCEDATFEFLLFFKVI
jgi:serine/threonine protein kinase